MSDSKARHVVVTGASSGIGWGIVKVLTAQGVHVFGSVRQEVDAARLRETFGSAVTPLRFDVTDEEAVTRAAKTVRDTLADEKLFGLINNAGIAIGGPLQHQPLDEIRQQLEVNLLGPLIVSRAFLPQLGAATELSGKPGRIVNLSSVGGKQAGPFLGAYAASKHGLEGFSESLRRELLVYGIDVIVVAPGAVKTLIWDKAEAQGIAQYSETIYCDAFDKFQAYLLELGRNKGLSPEYLGNVVWQALSIRRPQVRYAPVPNKLMSWTIPQLLPKRVIDRALARNFGWNH